MSISIKNIVKVYSGQKALNDVSFNINSGEIVGFLGPNGAGKSTMMKILTGLIPQTSGEAFVNGVNVREDSKLVRSNIGYLPENNPLYTDMYVKEYLEFVAGVYKIKKHKNARIKEIIHTIGLDVEQHKKIKALSKGFKQRVGLAQALIHDPSVLILDEPTTGLDPNQIVEIRNLISSIGKQKTVMLSTHIMQEVEAVCDRIVIINNGLIVANDTTENIKKIIDVKGSVIVVEFDKPVNKKDLLKVEGVNDAINTRQNIWEVNAGEIDIRSTLFNMAVSKNIAILSMQEKSQSLEMIFQQLTEK